MAISSINGYLDQASSNASSTSSARLESSARYDYSAAEDQEMMDACKKFEAYFIEQVLKEVKKTIPEHQYEDGSTETLVNYFEDNYVTQIAERMTDSQGIGLAQQMYDQMKRNYEGVYSIAQLQAKELQAAEGTEEDADSEEDISAASQVASQEEL